MGEGLWKDLACNVGVFGHFFQNLHGGLHLQCYLKSERTSSASTNSLVSVETTGNIIMISTRSSQNCKLI